MNGVVVGKVWLLAGRADAPEQKCVGLAQQRINL